MREQHSPVALLDLILRGVGLDIEQVIQLGLLDHVCGLSSCVLGVLFNCRVS